MSGILSMNDRTLLVIIGNEHEQTGSKPNTPTHEQHKEIY